MENSKVFKGIAFTIAAMACFAAMASCVRWVSADMPTTQLVFLRNVMSLGLILTWIGLRTERTAFRTARLSGHFWRSGIGFISMEIWFYALSILPLSVATALSFTTPVFGTMFAIWILKEHVGWRRWTAIGVSFIGVLIILHPSPASFDASASIVLISSGLMALVGIIIKSLTRTDSPETIVLYMALFMTPLSLPLALMHWQPVSDMQWLGIFLVALFSTTAHLLMARSYSYADMVTLLPFDFMRLLFTAVLAWMIFGEVIDNYTLTGAAIILAASVYIVHREAVKRSAAAAAAEKEMEMEI